MILKPRAFTLQLRPRERRLTIVAVVLTSCWLLVSKVVHPLWERGRDLRLHVRTQTEKLATISQLLESSPAVERAYRQLSGYLQSGEQEGAQRAFLNRLETLSTASDIRLNLKPRPGRRDERVSRFEVEVDVEGSQQNLLRFLDALLRAPELLVIERLRIATVPARENVLRANLAIQHLSLIPQQ